MRTDQHILIAGGSGMIGTRLIQMLTEHGYSVSVLSRSTKDIKGAKVFQWDVEHGYIDINALKNITTIINLSGQDIADKAWSKIRKRELQNSRTKSTQLLFKTLKNTSHHVESFINASAIGIYKPGDDLIDETSAHDKGFLASVCEQWESEAEKIKSLNVRTVIFRIGLVMSKRGGMLKEMLLPMKFFIAPVFGSGKHWQSWIHINDLCRMMIYAMENKDMQGVYNAVAPEPVSNINLVRAIQAALKNVTFKIHVPEFLLKIFLGERVEMLFSSHRVSDKKIADTGFEFHFNNSVDAIIHCVSENI